MIRKMGVGYFLKVSNYQEIGYAIVKELVSQERIAKLSLQVGALKAIIILWWLLIC